tara:strand:- start:910 stop:2064 length:1155 start_codon:yes stop_codon:yes gene_type:complete
MVLLFASSAHALGISPAKKILDHELGVREVTFKVYNDENKDMRAVLFTKGDLDEYIKVKESLVTLSPNDEYKEYTFIIDLPEDIGDPGIHTTEIIVMELPDDYQGESGIVSAKASVVAELNIRVPYPGKYAIANMEVSSAEIGEEVKFTIPVQNYGKQQIFHAKANIELFGATYERIAYIETNDIPINKKEQGKLFAIWKADVNPGVYHAKATIYYDDQKIEIEKDFNVGSAGLEITKILAEPFKLGDVAIFDIFIKNNWNDIIKGAHGKMTIKGDDGTVYSTFNTETIDIDSYDEEMLKAYWNTRDATVGTYTMEVVIEWGSHMIEKVQEIQVNLDSISVSPTGLATGVTSSIFSKESILTVLVFILVIINIGWFFYFRKKKV